MTLAAIREDAVLLMNTTGHASDSCAVASAASAISDQDSGDAPMAQLAALQIIEMYREMESLETALLQEKQRSVSLEEESAAREEAHQRDVAALEAMLRKVCIERDRLALEKNNLEGLAKTSMSCSTAATESGPSPASSEEPELEHACDLEHADELQDITVKLSGMDHLHDVTVRLTGLD